MTDSILSPRTEGLTRRIIDLKAEKKSLRVSVETIAQDNLHRDLVRYLTLLPGFNDIRAMTMMGETGDVWRFADEEKFARYCGVVTKEKQSGKRDWRGGTAEGKKYLSYALNQSAKILMGRLEAGTFASSTETESLPPEVAEIVIKTRHTMTKKYYKLKHKRYPSRLIRGALAHMIAIAVYKVLRWHSANQDN